MATVRCKFSFLCSPAKNYLRYSLFRCNFKYFRTFSVSQANVRIRPNYVYSIPVRNFSRRNHLQQSAILGSNCGSLFCNLRNPQHLRYFSSQPSSVGAGGSGDSGAPAGGEGAGGSGGDDGPHYQEPPIPETPETVSVSLTPVTVPEYFPIVPVIAVKRNPLFPRFVKLLEVSLIYKWMRQVEERTQRLDETIISLTLNGPKDEPGVLFFLLIFATARYNDWAVFLF